MIYDSLVRFGSKHPSAMRGLVGTLTYVVFGYIALSAITGQIVDGNRQTCERDNAARLAEFREKEELISAVTRKQGAAEAKGEDAIAKSLGEEVNAYKKKQKALEDIAEASGHQNTPRSVTINCIEEWPKPLTIGG